MKVEKILFNDLVLYKIKSGRSLASRLIDKDYIIVYDETLLGDGDKCLFAPSTLGAKDYYRIIKHVYPYGYGIFNMLSIGYCSDGWFK